VACNYGQATTFNEDGTCGRWTFDGPVLDANATAP
jgi:hypothetical protein